MKIYLALWLSLIAGIAAGQTGLTIHGRVVDRAGLPVGRATVSARSGSSVLSAFSNADGEFSVDVAADAGQVAVSASSGEMVSSVTKVARADLAASIVLVVAPSAVEQQVSVTATRSGVDMGPAGRTVESLSAEQLEQYPALTLDERLRQHAGFELFRRSSGWVQNPTSQGISLRGLGSTAVSRTLVLADEAPLNDPFGGWIHWNELPPEAIEAVTIATGGGSDLYGSSALGGVIDVVPVRPAANSGEVSASGAGEDTASGSGRANMQQEKWGELVAGQYFRTDGYTLVASQLRGPVDIPANVHFENGRTEFDRKVGEAGRAFLVGNVLNEARSNGTPDQINGTRLWRYLAGDDWAAGSKLNGRARLFGSDEAYRQSFSSIAASRATEKLTRLQQVGTQELGGSTDASFQLRHAALVGGADVRDIRATDLETPIAVGKPSGVQDTTARQRFVGGFGEALGEYKGWSGTISLRADRAQNLSSFTFAQTGSAAATRSAIADRSEVVLSPRIGLVRRLGSQVDIHAAAFRAFRSPTMNELYRTGQVGQETTIANSALTSERATGTEGGVAWRPTNLRLGLDATYFWTEINRPVSAVVLRSTATSITEMRENLGQIQSQGVEIAARVNEGHAISANFGYQYAHAVVTKFSAQPALVGNWIPEVPRESATAQIRAATERYGVYTLAMRESGRAFDDSANTYLLHGFFVMDLYGERSFKGRWTVFVAGQNLLDRKIDVARTPILTQGTPFTIQGGVRLHWGGSDSK